jgi:hypothetical protein
MLYLYNTADREGKLPPKANRKKNMVCEKVGDHWEPGEPTM